MSISLTPATLTGYKHSSLIHQLSHTNCARPFKHHNYPTFLTKLAAFGSHGFQENDPFELAFQSGIHKLQELASDNTTTLDSLITDNHDNHEFALLDFGQPLEEDTQATVSQPDDNGKNGNLEYEPKRNLKGKVVSRSRKQLMKRSSILAKQVIGVDSASTLGFVSQLWVHTSTWAVLEVEVRPNFLSSESGRLLLEDINKVGDVVLVQEENYVLNEFRTVGLETLVGYSVVTSGGINLGKVRGYTFNINSGTVDSIELDAFGYSIIPSNLVSTYALFAEDVLEVVSDVIIVHEAAASRIQRLTKGFLGTNNTEKSRSINVKYHDVEEKTAPPLKDRKIKRKASKRKLYSGTTDLGNDFELPMDYM